MRSFARILAGSQRKVHSAPSWSQAPTYLRQAGAPRARRRGPGCSSRPPARAGTSRDALSSRRTASPAVQVRRRERRNATTARASPLPAPRSVRRRVGETVQTSRRKANAPPERASSCPGVNGGCAVTQRCASIPAAAASPRHPARLSDSLGLRSAKLPAPRRHYWPYSGTGAAGKQRRSLSSAAPLDDALGGKSYKKLSHGDTRVRQGSHWSCHSLHSTRGLKKLSLKCWLQQNIIFNRWWNKSVCRHRQWGIYTQVKYCVLIKVHHEVACVWRWTVESLFSLSRARRARRSCNSKYIIRSKWSSFDKSEEMVANRDVTDLKQQTDAAPYAAVFAHPTVWNASHCSAAQRLFHLLTHSSEEVDEWHSLALLDL